MGETRRGPIPLPSECAPGRSGRTGAQGCSGGVRFFASDDAGHPDRGRGASCRPARARTQPQRCIDRTGGAAPDHRSARSLQLRRLTDARQRIVLAKMKEGVTGRVSRPPSSPQRARATAAASPGRSSFAPVILLSRGAWCRFLGPLRPSDTRQAGGRGWSDRGRRRQHRGSMSCDLSQTTQNVPQTIQIAAAIAISVAKPNVPT